MFHDRRLWFNRVFFSFLFFSHSLQELYSCASHGRPILHDTLLKFSFQRVTDRAVVGGGDRGDGRHRTRFPFGDSDDETEGAAATPAFCDVFKVTGCVVSPLQMSLSRAQYLQILDSFDNLSWVNKIDAGVGAAAAATATASAAASKSPEPVDEQQVCTIDLIEVPIFQAISSD